MTDSDGACPSRAARSAGLAGSSLSESAAAAALAQPGRPLDRGPAGDSDHHGRVTDSDRHCDRGARL
jgi:hypothetical protein